MKEPEQRRESQKTDEKSYARARPEAKEARSGRNPLLDLQRTVGNEAVVRLFEAGGIQAKLRVSQPGDADELEADLVAESIVSSFPAAGRAKEAAVSSTSEPTVHRKCNCVGGGTSCPECEEEEVESARGIHRKAASSSGDTSTARVTLMQDLGPGHPLDPALRQKVESQFGHDFTGVRVHDDSAAAKSARSIEARAYTAGNNIVFDAGEYSPRTSAGNKLLAHELAHVVQQNQAPSPPKIHRQAAAPAPTGLPDKSPPGMASREDVRLALTEFLTRVQTDSGTHTLVVNAPVRQALQMLAEGDFNARLRIDLFLSQTVVPGMPDEFARQAVTRLPPLIPRSRLDHLDRIPTTEAKDTRPTTLGTAVGAVFDSTVAPLIKALPIPADQQAKLADAARSAIGDGMVGLVDAAMAGSPIDDKTKAAIHAAVAAAIKQPSAGRKAKPASPFVQPAPPSIVPPMPAVPGQSIQQAPSIDILDGGGPKPAAPVPPTASTLEQAIQRLDKDSLVPPEARGKPAAAKFENAQLFAREVANALETAQRARQFTAELTLKGVYRDVQDGPAIFDEVARIVRLVADALPVHAAQVGQVIVQIEDTNRRRVIPLH